MAYQADRDLVRVPSRCKLSCLDFLFFSSQNKKLSRFWVGKGASSASYFPPPLDEFSFREALDEFASAEMRLGK